MYTIGQTFKDIYPPEAAQWCDENGAIIIQVDGGFRIHRSPPATAVQLSLALRTERDARLAATDKYLLADYPISTEDLDKIKAYRQALRGLPEQEGAPWDGGGELTPWPEKPDIA